MSLQLAGGCLVFCTTRRQCETQAKTFSALLATHQPLPSHPGAAPSVAAVALAERSAPAAAPHGTPQSAAAAEATDGTASAHALAALIEVREERECLALELAAAQGGEIGEPLKGLLLACTGVAYHHAGALRLAIWAALRAARPFVTLPWGQLLRWPPPTPS